MSSRCAPALHYKVSGIGRKRLPHNVGQTLSSVNSLCLAVPDAAAEGGDVDLAAILRVHRHAAAPRGATPLGRGRSFERENVFYRV
jgi:hypothetical protein